ncbi:hypothetical protein MJO28_003859 [Puccinia striiformis f. sp. tritici]|uniref:Uncharacterized protein n=1 Tax=Puccinia striiformis f. sp. tritici TaxID=168172 RepID=A0ACC0EMB0_9BASI|nr:hypothetical protein MJO28_003859 [Puccinia striiformis f. sp. tritici]
MSTSTPLNKRIRKFLAELNKRQLVPVRCGECRYRDHCRIYRITPQRLQFLRRSLTLINSPKQKMKIIPIIFFSNQPLSN